MLLHCLLLPAMETNDVSFSYDGEGCQNILPCLLKAGESVALLVHLVR